MNGSVVMAKMAGIESTAKMTSVNATIIITTNSGVYFLIPSSRTMKDSPW